MRAIVLLCLIGLAGAAMAQPGANGPSAGTIGGPIPPAPPSVEAGGVSKAGGGNGGAAGQGAATIGPADQAGGSPGGLPADAASDPAVLDAITGKVNAYVAYMNRTLRAVDSLDRYKSWVNMRTGPTGRERLVYGLYAPYDVTDERAAVEKALAAPPPLPDLDAAMSAYVSSNDALAPTLTKADGYYSRADYKLDRFAEGKALHGRIVAEGYAFIKARARLDAVMRVRKLALDALRLAAIEKKDGRRARWHIGNVMMRGKVALDALTAGGDVDTAAFADDMARFGEAVKGLDDYAAAHPRALGGFSSFPDSLLSHMREVQGRLKRARGNLARAAGLDMTFIQSDWNAMVTTADLPLAHRDE